MPLKTWHLSLRTCCRCGAPFNATSRQLVCEKCIKPVDTKKLSFRERQILTLVYQDASANKEIAFRLRLSEGTVKEYLNRMFRKLGINSRLQLLNYAHDHPELLLESVPE